VSDNWPGLDSFFMPGKEILLPTSSDDVVHYLQDVDDAELQRIGQAAADRVLAEHTSDHCAQQLEQLVEQAGARRSPTLQAIAN
jgi:spore maturation protein CgeB